MTIKQGTNDANIITGALTSTTGVVASSIKITLRITRSVLVGVSRPSIMVPWWWAIIVVTLIRVIVIVLMGSVPVVAPTSLGLGILTPTSGGNFDLDLPDGIGSDPAC